MFTLAIIAATVLVSWRAFNDQRLLGRLILWPPAVTRNRQYDRLLGYGFIHADWAAPAVQHDHPVVVRHAGRAGVLRVDFAGRLPAVLPVGDRGLDPADLHEAPARPELPQPGRVRRGLGGAVRRDPVRPVVEADHLPDPAADPGLPVRACCTWATASGWTGAAAATSTTARTCGGRPTACCSPCCCGPALPATSRAACWDRARPDGEQP